MQLCHAGMATKPRHLRPRREKVFGDGRPRALDRNAKARIMVLARALMRRVDKGKHYGAISAKAFAVLEALLWGFHNARSGLCFPSYESIAKKAGCARSTVAEAIKALEAAGLLSWVNRIVRIKERCVDLLGANGLRSRVIRTSNGYRLNDPQPPSRPEFLGASPADSSKSDLPTGVLNQESFPLIRPAKRPPLDPNNPLEAVLLRGENAVKAMEARKAAK